MCNRIERSTYYIVLGYEVYSTKLVAKYKFLKLLMAKEEKVS